MARKTFKKLMNGLDEVEAHLKNTQRFRFVSDDDGHNYLIKNTDTIAFEKWLAAGPYWEDYDGPDFESINSISEYSFVDPQLD